VADAELAGTATQFIDIGVTVITIVRYPRSPSCPQDASAYDAWATRASAA
jgi:hypothetical protein